MKYLLPLLLSSCAAAPVYSEVVQSPRMTLLPEKDHCFAVIEVVNTVGNYNNTEVLSTKHGDVHVKYTTVGGHNPDDNDIVEVVSWPDSIVVSPVNIDLPDGDTGYICLMDNNLS